MIKFEMIGFNAARQGTNWEILFWLKDGGVFSWKLDPARSYYQYLDIGPETPFDNRLGDVDEVVISKFAHQRELMLKFSMNILLNKNLIGNKEKLFIHPKEWKNL